MIFLVAKNKTKDFWVILFGFFLLIPHLPTFFFYSFVIYTKRSHFVSDPPRTSGNKNPFTCNAVMPFLASYLKIQLYNTLPL